MNNFVNYEAIEEQLTFEEKKCNICGSTAKIYFHGVWYCTSHGLDLLCRK